MKESQLKKIIREEIDIILKEGIGDIKRAQRANNKNFTDPLIARRSARLDIAGENKLKNQTNTKVSSILNKMESTLSKIDSITLGKIQSAISKYQINTQENLTLVFLEELEKEINFKAVRYEEHSHSSDYSTIEFYYELYNTITDFSYTEDKVLDILEIIFDNRGGSIPLIWCNEVDEVFSPGFSTNSITNYDWYDVFKEMIEETEDEEYISKKVYAIEDILENLEYTSLALEVIVKKINSSLKKLYQQYK